ncbi:MAG: glycerol kinase GlpK [Myxococcales bacterium]|nr:glycerol kinase GlpK [Myxococcales bacterium]MCB9709289.1 glycerol kinase GlpK [Myxococcales bacterium]
MTKHRHLLAIDQGTTGSTALILTEEAKVVAKASCDFSQHFPKPGWVEHDTEEIWQSVVEAVLEAMRLSGAKPKSFAAIGITNQRETTVLWDKHTQKAVHPAVVWQDRRTAPMCEALRAKGLEPLFRERTGLLLDPYFSGTKIAWLLDNVEGLRERAEEGHIAFGTIDSFLVNRLTGGQSHFTDATNASRTLLYDLRRGTWDQELAAHLGVPLGMLPEVRDSAEIVAHTKGVRGLPDGIPIGGIAGDQQAALFGQTCFDVGDAKCTYGTGAFLLINTGYQAVIPQHNILSTVAWQINGRRTFALEGSAFVAGAAVQWLRDGLGLITEAREIEALAASVPETGDVIFVPALTGLGAPYWNPHARGLIAGITRDTTRAHLARATLEGIAFQIADLAEEMQKESGQSITKLRVDGGASMNALLMQFQADILDTTIHRPRMVETTALGAAYLAGLASGVFPSLNAIRERHAPGQKFEPAMGQKEARARRARWKKAVERVMLV